ncbi:MAG TPA: succinate dehydrogenase [Thermoanaerobaculia bacterium]|nr:succinate dehydrogenase [Thermoanaerobaculia bacterium]
MSTVQLDGHATGLGATARTDRWWLTPLLYGLGLAAFVVYSTWAAFQGEHYYHEPYLSPMYAPVLYTDPGQVGSAPVEHAWLGAKPAWWPGMLPFSPAFLILAFPGSFRLTCYYYRKAYYRSYFFRPPACAVGARQPGRYNGETRLALFQNLHRYTLIFALALVPILYYDAFLAFFRGGRFGVGVGSLVLLLNATLLAAYTFGCHSWRHLIGGKMDCFSCDAGARVRYGVWKKSSWLNARHQLFAWTSLFWVGFTDLYVRLVSMGVWTDLNTWG